MPARGNRLRTGRGRVRMRRRLLHGVPIMNRENLELLRQLLTGQRVLSLAVVVDKAPVAGLLPFLAAPDFTSLLVHTSRMARHAAGLEGEPARWSAVIHLPDSPERDPLQVPRVVMYGRSHSVPTGGKAHEEARRLWVERFPTAAMTVSLADFAFHRLDIESGRLIGGFAGALNLSMETLTEAAALVPTPA
jgi:heme iron utilization protein